MLTRGTATEGPTEGATQVEEAVDRAVGKAVHVVTHGLAHACTALHPRIPVAFKLIHFKVLTQHIRGNRQGRDEILQSLLLFRAASARCVLVGLGSLRSI